MVAKKTNKLIGLGHYHFHHSTIYIGLVCYIQDLFTMEIARGNGVGYTLIDKVSEEVGSAGSKRIYWQTHEKILQQ